MHEVAGHDYSEVEQAYLTALDFAIKANKPSLQVCICVNLLRMVNIERKRLFPVFVTSKCCSHVFLIFYDGEFKFL